MKKTLLIVVFVFLLIGCNMNPNKEERIQKLETEIQVTLEKIQVMEDRFEDIQEKNTELEIRINELNLQHKTEK
ncbi:hypothetical protein [uncultured Croceitalea sp.]|uniref:hypothetical protein n=1 Tax=uncultured Croceitalea sp. TaxID=1798908 RepID=UPI0033064091